MEDHQKIIKGEEIINIPTPLPLLPIRDMVIFPYSVVPLLIGREKSIAAIDAAKSDDNYIVVATQKNASKENIKSSDIRRVGTICKVLQVLTFPNGHSKVVVEGLIRANIQKFKRNKNFFLVDVDIFDEDMDANKKMERNLSQLLHLFQEYLSFTPDLPNELFEHLLQQGDPYRMIDYVAMNINAEPKQKQRVLQESNIEKRLALLIDLVRQLIVYFRIRQDIDRKVQANLVKNQRSYYRQEKLKIINKELGEEDDQNSPEISKIEDEILAANMPEYALDKATEELTKLKRIPPFSPEYTVTRNYLDWMVNLPWENKTGDQLNINTAQKILDRDHFGLKKPKDRIIEHLAVLKRVKKMKGPILCLVGPPGVGKTSLGKSIATALGREFVRISLGGVRDEAEIRGHRRTYIGAMPGKIIQSMKKAGSKNPVFLLDEIDKMSNDFRGDPASALLEVLDPEQNKTFNDHYLDLDYDLSEVLFLTTANVQHRIPEPLQDRMEMIPLPGYLEHEKYDIAKRHLVPKQLEAHGLTAKEFSINKQGLTQLILDYTREAGVRNLERQIASLCRKAVKQLATDPDSSVKMTARNLAGFIGKPLVLNRKMDLKPQIGMATGLAYTAYGGDLLKIESTILPGKGKLILTGKLGDVMKESAHTALSYIRSIADDWKIDKSVFETKDIHIHVPEGAVPKDGPSAGITITATILSALTKIKIRNNIAMTGEMTLRGQVLAIGGLSEKLMAAHRNGVKTVIIPHENEKDIAELPQLLKDALEIIQAKHFLDVFKVLAHSD